MTLDAALADPLTRWLQQGRTPVARTPAGIVRIGAPRHQQRALDARAALPPALRALAPALIETCPHGDQLAILEADLGAPTGALSRVDAFHAASPGQQVHQEDTLGALLEAAKPWPGRLKLTPFIRALRAEKKAGHPLPFSPNQQKLQAALSTTLAFTEPTGWVHGAITADRVLERGLCHWHRARPDGPRAADRAPLLSLDDATTAELVHAAALALRTDPLRAAEALARLLPNLSGAPRQATLHASGHPGLSAAQLSSVLGCPLGTPAPASQVARALYRAVRLTIGGVPLRATSEPAVRPRKDSAFWLARNRDPRRLFSKWDQGIRLDEDPEARFSVTPEAMALQIADQLQVRGKVVVDGFCGAGGNAIAFARRGATVIALDTDARRLEMARQNARIYGVADRIQFQRADFFTANVSGDLLFLDPPWAKGADFLNAAWEYGKRRFETGMIKLPKEHTVPISEAISLFTTGEGFPAFVSTRW